MGCQHKMLYVTVFQYGRIYEYIVFREGSEFHLNN